MRQECPQRVAVTLVCRWIFLAASLIRIRIGFQVRLLTPAGSLRRDMAISSSGITALLRAWNEGDDQALSKLTTAIYEELYRLARYYMSGQPPEHELQSTALVNEIYLQINKLQKTDWQSRSHFFAVCAQLMQHVLTDYARSHRYLKRGGEALRVPLHENIEVASSDTGSKLIALEDSLRDLAALDQRASQVVRLRFFGGFSLDEIAVALNVSERTVRRDWQFAKFWLAHELKNGNRNRCG